MAGGAAPTMHDHDARDAVPVRGRWAIKCACGHTSFGATLDLAARAHRGHAEVEAWSAATARR